VRGRAHVKSTNFEQQRLRVHALLAARLQSERIALDDAGQDRSR